MPLFGRILKMRSWMIGVVTGYLTISVAPALPPLWVAFLFIGAAGLMPGRGFPLACIGSGILFGIAGGTLYGYSVLASRVDAQCEAIPLSIEGVIVSLPRHSLTRDGGSRQRFEFRPEKVEPQRCEGPDLLLLSYYGDRQMNPGERWRLQVSLKKPWGLANPGSFNMQQWYAQAGIDGTGNVKKNYAVLLSVKVDRRLQHHAVRRAISERLDQLGLEERITGILQALTVADKSGIDGGLWTLFQYYGVNHLLVISGLHINLIAAPGYLFGGVLGRLAYALGAVRIAAVIPGLMALGFAFAYAALAGFALATVRALSMLACFVAASMVARESLSWNNALIACVLVLMANPLSAVGSGFWLSFSAVACLLWLGMWQAHSRLPLRLLHTHVYMALAMIPLGGWWFGGVSQVAVPANFFLVPIVGFYVLPIALLAVLAFLVGIPVDHQLWALAAWPLEQLLPHADNFAMNHSELLYVYLSPSLPQVLLALVALALLVVPLPGRIKLLLPVLALPVFLSIGSKNKVSEYHTRITVLDVGQGTAIVIQSGGYTMVYDTGGGDPNGYNMASAVILPYLRVQGVSGLHTLMVSHPDNDHSAGTDTIMKSLPVQQLVTGGEPTGYPNGRICRAGEAWQWPTGVRFQVLSPEPPKQLSSNNSSCVLQVHIAGFRFLIPGDIDAGREREIVSYWRQQLRSDWQLAAHHGSLSSSSYPWLKAVRPSQVVYSHGYLNHFGHPHWRVKKRNSEFGSLTFSTATDGALEIDIDPVRGVTTHAYRWISQPYWM